MRDAARSTAIRGAGSMAGTRGGLHAAWTEDLGERIEKGVSGAGENRVEGPSAVPSGGSRTSGKSAENEIEGQLAEIRKYGLTTVLPG